MRVVVVYESLFGNTRDVAEAVAAGIVAASPSARVDCRCVDELASLADVDLVVVGGPTHALGLTTRMTRALEFQYERRLRARLGRSETGPRRAAETTGLRAWLAGLPPGADTAAAAFDTRMDAVVPGGAAPRIARRLSRRGYRLVAEPAAFTVEGVAGPLRAGELERATCWGEHLAGALSARRHPVAGTFQPVPLRPWRHSMNDTQVGTTTSRTVDGGAATSFWRPSGQQGPVDLTRLLTTAEMVIGAVLVAYRLSRRPAAPKALVTMGPGGWVSMKGGTVAVRPASRPWGRPRPLPHPASTERAPVWARVLSAVPLQSLIK